MTHNPASRLDTPTFQCSSASRKFLNCMFGTTAARYTSMFQCSSASRKFLNRVSACVGRRAGWCFSALQRAENSSMTATGSPMPSSKPFQCSSASRKFLNLFECQRERVNQQVSVLFSEPKIPQCYTESPEDDDSWGFSALQRAENSSIDAPTAGEYSFRGFSALQRAENSSIPTISANADCTSAFQCSSASRKFLNLRPRASSGAR